MYGVSILETMLDRIELNTTRYDYPNIEVNDYIYIEHPAKHYWIFGLVINFDKHNNTFGYKILDSSFEIYTSNKLNSFELHSNHHHWVKVYKSIEDYVIDVKL